MIEDDSYGPLLAICLEKQAEKDRQLAEVQAYQLPENQNEEMAEDQNQEIAEEEQPNQLAGEEQEEEKVISFSSFSFSSMHVHKSVASIVGIRFAWIIRNHWQASWTWFTQMVYNLQHDPSFVIQEQEQDMQIEYGRDQADELSINSDAVMDPSPAALHLGEASADYAQGSVGGSKSFYSYP